jgi:flavin reductase (DIM6/NTAB) family NADH-FMN oxidoreductase RutF
MIALYQGTKTYANVLESKRAVLQLLSEPLAPVIRVCGHESGHVTHKITRLQKKYDLETIHGLSYFIEAAGYMELLLDKLVSVDGDHDLGIFSVVIHKNLNDVPLLTTDYLRSKGLLR